MLVMLLKEKGNFFVFFFIIIYRIYNYFEIKFLVKKKWRVGERSLWLRGFEVFFESLILVFSIYNRYFIILFVSIRDLIFFLSFIRYLYKRKIERMRDRKFRF